MNNLIVQLYTEDNTLYKEYSLNCMEYELRSETRELYENNENIIISKMITENDIDAVNNNCLLINIYKDYIANKKSENSKQLYFSVLYNETFLFEKIPIKFVNYTISPTFVGQNAITKLNILRVESIIIN